MLKVTGNTSFKLHPGQILWVRGDNGAGKSTLLKTILGIIPASNTQIHWTSDRPSIFYLAHDLALQRQLTVLEYCHWHPAIQKKPSESMTKQVLQKMGLLKHAFQLCGQLSRGQQQRLLLACAQLSEAKLWLLDEPFTALDANSRHIMIETLLAHKALGGSAIVVSHQPIEISDEVLDVVA